MSADFKRTVAGFALLAGGALAFAPASPLSAAPAQGRTEAAAELKATCKLAGKARVATASGGTATTSPDYVDVSGTKIARIKLKKAGCIIVQFSAEVNSGVGDSMAIRVFLDGSTPCRPFEAEFNNAPVAFDRATRAMNFVCKDVAAGKHSLTIQYKRMGSGGNAFLGNRTTIAQW